MRHLRYLRYLLLHKLYVFAGGVAVARVRIDLNNEHWHWGAWLVRLLIHDLSKFRPSEWRPYAATFYGPDRAAWIARRKLQLLKPNEGMLSDRAQVLAENGWDVEERSRRALFNRAWLAHIHRNPHHWQHWILHEDSGKVLVLLQSARLADEMVADWLGAGAKVLSRPTLAECVAATVKWYAANHQQMQLRDAARKRVEQTLMLLSARYGLVAAALEIRAAEQARASVVIPGR